MSKPVRTPMDATGAFAAPPLGSANGGGPTPEPEPARDGGPRCPVCRIVNCPKSPQEHYPSNTLSAHDAGLLLASGISPDLAARRKYQTITEKAKLTRFGFKGAQVIVPTLLGCVFDLRGQIASYQHRPIEPRVGNDGKTVKYEVPKGSTALLDLPPTTPNEWIGSQGIPLLFTEGMRKADAARSIGLCCINLPAGVWGWRGTNQWNGKTSLAEFELLTLEGRLVLIVFDSDAVTKPGVYAALVRFKKFLEFRKAVVRIVYFNPGDGGVKVGLDDFIVARRAEGMTDEEIQSALFARSSEALPPPPPETAPTLDVKAWLIEHGQTITQEDRRGPRVTYRLAQCPWQDQHPDRRIGPEVEVSDAGSIVFRCNASACTHVSVTDRRGRTRERSRNWTMLRDLLDPGWQDRERVATDTAYAHPYRIEHGRFYWKRDTREGPVTTALCNFTAEVTEELVLDDGVETTRAYAIEGALDSGIPLPPVRVPEREFAAMDWVGTSWGLPAVMTAGQGTRDHLRAAIQVLSPEADTRHLYTHTGWRAIGAWVYLHANGAIGTDGSVEDVQVRLPETLSRFALPDPPTGDARITAIRASLNVLDGLAPDPIMVPLYAAMARVALGGTVDFGLHVSGRTGLGKTELAALIQQHFGAEMIARNLPGSWLATGNALESLAFTAKDAVLVIDDFAPTGSEADVHRLHREADRVLRAQGNAAGRDRLRRDSTLQPAKRPRGLIISTGEDVPRGQSLRSRIGVIEMEAAVDWARLTACQADAAAGLYAQALAGFLHWIAPQHEAVLQRLRLDLVQHRQAALGSGGHRRTADIAAQLTLGMRTWLTYAKAAGAITAEEGDRLRERTRVALIAMGQTQRQQQDASDPVRRYLELIAAALASGRCHVASVEGRAPEPLGEWGWHLVNTEMRAHGDRIGWVAGEDLYLEQEATFVAVQRMAREQGEALTIGSKTLSGRLAMKGLLLSKDRKDRHTVRKTAEGQRREVLHLAVRSIFPPIRKPMG